MYDVQDVSDLWKDMAERNTKNKDLGLSSIYEILISNMVLKVQIVSKYYTHRSFTSINLFKVANVVIKVKFTLISEKGYTITLGLL